MSYLRDGEEPTRWAFCSLGQSRRADDAPSEEQPRPTPLVDGSFYPASSVSASVDLNQGEMRARISGRPEGAAHGPGREQA